MTKAFFSAMKPNDPQAPSPSDENFKRKRDSNVDNTGSGKRCRKNTHSAQEFSPFDGEESGDLNTVVAYAAQEDKHAAADSTEEQIEEGCQDGSKSSHCAEDIEDEEDLDWDSIAQHEPAQSDVPVFLAARERRDVAEVQFASALDEAHANLKQLCDDLLNTAAGLFNDQREKLDVMESQIKQDFATNEESRANMQKKLEESASAAQAQFTQLMMRVTQFGNNPMSRKDPSPSSKNV